MVSRVGLEPTTRGLKVSCLSNIFNGHSDRFSICAGIDIVELSALVGTEKRFPRAETYTDDAAMRVAQYG